MIRACVIGHPLGYSLSPTIHNYWFERLGIAGSYTAMPIAPDDLESGIAALKAQGFAGFNVTIPHKQAIMRLCASRDDAASAIGAVNTVVIEADGSLHGRNTDAIGFTRNIEESHPDFDWSARPALVLGAGGAARAIIHALRQKGVQEIRIANRTPESAQALADDFGAGTVPWEDRDTALAGIGMLINTTALGMTGKPALAFDLSRLPTDALVSDIVYAPLWTPLLAAAQARGNAVSTGIGMLLHQAAPAFQAWTGVAPTVDEALRRLVLDQVR